MVSVDARALKGMAILHLAKGDTPRAVSFFTRIAEESESRVTKTLGSGSERQKLRLMQSVSAETDLILSLHAQYAPDNPDAWRLALTTILRRKGRALDAMTDTLKALRAAAEPQDQAMLDQLAEARARLATATLEGPDETAPAQRRALLKRLESRIKAARERDQRSRRRVPVAGATDTALRRRRPSDSVRRGAHRIHDLPTIRHQDPKARAAALPCIHPDSRRQIVVARPGRDRADQPGD